MPKIQILDSVVIDRIAAGEVVERPASVVKELVENALDAGATRISVQLQDAGVGLVEVGDDGHGMDADDVELAFAQHATSKVRTVDDLDAIGTMGFRGEALASIASVSRVELVTGTGEGSGVRVRVSGGRVEAIEPIASPRGTMVRVADLFFNTPARRKNLKTPATELRHASHAVIDYALGHPERYISLAHGARTLLAAPPVGKLEERVHQVFGAGVASHWLSVEGRSGTLQIRGGLTSPEHQRPNRNDIRWYVNGRPVADYRLVHALTGAYDTLLDKQRFPVAVIFLELPAADVDVNVHPRKTEVRFAQPGAVYRAVRRAVRDSLARHLPPVKIHPRAPEHRTDGVAAQLPVDDWIVADGGRSGAELPDPVLSRRGNADRPGPAQRIRETSGAIRPLTQYANTYILASDARGLLIIDQHVAHERVLYEQILAQLRRRGVEAQHLLVPERIELSASEVATLEAHRELLASFGVDLEPFGGDTWAIRTAPEVLGNRNLGEAVRSLIESLGQGQGPEALDDARHEIAASIACHAAVRANHPLGLEEMVRLIADLERCDSPTRCPHGRPVLVRLEHDELEKSLKRH